MRQDHESTLRSEESKRVALNIDTLGGNRRIEEFIVAKSNCCGEDIEYDNSGKARCSKCGAAQG